VLPGPATGRPLDSPRLADVDKPGYSEPPLAGDETATLLGSLERLRATVAWKCGGLDAAGHAGPHPGVGGRAHGGGPAAL